MNSILIVRYESNPNDFITNVEKLSLNYRVYIYDNSLISLDFYNENVFYFHDPENSGLARAINYCINQAVQDGADEIVYFDQDSLLSFDLIDRLIESFQLASSKYPDLFVLGPQPVMKNGTYYPVAIEKRIESDLFLASEIITSGMVFKPSLVKQLGGFDEDLFLDLVDFDICWRAQRAGYLVFIDQSIKMVHEVGQSVIKMPFKILPISSPIRNYYQLRNMLYLSLYKYDVSKARVLYYLLRRSCNIILNLLFADHRLLRMKYNALGVRDALAKKMGKANLK